MIERLLLFGASGDLAGRFLLPALAALHAAQKLPETFSVVGAARQDWDDDGFREAAAEKLAEHASDVPTHVRDLLLRSLRYRPVDVADPRSVAAVVGVDDGPIAVYLALPPSAFPAAVEALAGAGLPAGSRVALEKPFGEDLESAVELNRLLARALPNERAVFRVDHLLGMPSAQNLLQLRLANPLLEAGWSSEHFEKVEILWEETLALEGRAAYYDEAGALKDVLQNHMLQLLCLVAMELPAGDEVHDRRLEALRTARVGASRRARYTAGRLASGDEVLAYVEEDGVDPSRQTETFAEIVLDLDTRRWAGTRFVLRAGKALGARRKMVVLHFRAPGTALRIGIDGPQEIELELVGGVSGAPVLLTLTSPSPASELPAYGHVLLDLLSGGSALSVRGDEAEAAWRLVTPILEEWRQGRVSLEEYAAGSAGPD